MPDGDRLDWKVQGKGSRRVLRLLQNGLDEELVADGALRMFVDQVNDGRWKPVFRQVVGILDNTLAEPHACEVGSEQIDSFLRLTNEIEAVVSNHGDRALAPLIRAAQRVFHSLRDGGGPIEVAEIRTRFLCEAAVTLLDHCVLQPTRQELSRRLNLSRDEQAYFESRVFEKMRNGTTRLCDSFFASPRELVRAPRRLRPKRSTDLERLHEPLPVVGGHL